MESWWRKETEISEGRKEKRDRANAAEHWDVIVIGAGMAGLLIAYYLKQEGRQVLVLEAAEVASGQTERTTAKITGQHGLKYSKLIGKVGEEEARLYAQAQEAAIREYEKLICEKQIDCQFERTCAFLYSVRDEAALYREVEAASYLGIHAVFTEKTELPFPVKGAVCFRDQAQFSPLAFAQCIAAELEIWEHTRVTDIRGNQVVTDAGTLTADKMVVATHYPILNVPGFYFLRQHQERSYVLALSGCRKITGMYYGIDPDGLSLRQAGEVLLLGGSAARTGQNETGGAYGFLIQAANAWFPDWKEEARWSAQDCMPHDGIPFIGKYSIFTPDLYVATGFQKWGMTSSMIAAMILRDELCGRKNPYAKLFSPQRFHLSASVGNLLLDVGMSAKGLAKGAFHRPKQMVDALPYGHGGLVTMDGKRYACYRDGNGELHRISARCPHMGCELTWNPDERSWDCPCHGSRFDVDGNLLDNPATENAKNR